MSFEPDPPKEPWGSAPSEPPPIAEPGTPAVTEGTGLPRNIAAALACIFLLPGGFIFYFLDRRDAFVRFYALQSIVLSVVSFVFFFSFSICLFIVSHIPIVRSIFSFAATVFDVVFVVFWFLLIFNAYQGKVLFEVPVLWRVAKRYIPKNLI